MKKMLVILVVLMLTFSMSALADGYFNVRLGYDMGGTMSGEISEDIGEELEDFKIDGGLFLSGEYFVPYNSDIDLGAGIKYQFNRTPKDAPSGNEINFIPLYGAAKYNMDDLFLVGKLGYNLFNTEEDLVEGVSLRGGLFYGIGAGVNFAEDLNAELLYSVNNGKYEFEGLEGSDFTYNIKYSKVSLSLGYSF